MRDEACQQRRFGALIGLVVWAPGVAHHVWQCSSWNHVAVSVGLVGGPSVHPQPLGRRASQSPVTIAREVNVNTFARSAPGQPWKLRQRQETRVDFDTNARSDQAQA